MEILHFIKKTITVSPGDSIELCLDIMVKSEMNYIPVVNNNNFPIGIVKITRFCNFIVNNTINNKFLKIHDVLSSKFELLRLQDKIELKKANSMMYKAVLVVDESNQFIGVFDTLKFIFAAYENLKETLSHYDTIFESSYDGIVVTDNKGLILRVNLAYERLTGLKQNQVLGKTFHELIEEGIFSKSVVDLVKKTRKTATVMVSPANKYVLCTGNPFFNSQGDIELIVINLRDITELNIIKNELHNVKELTERYHNELKELRIQQTEGMGLIIKSQSMNKLVNMVMRVARTESTVFITGESGVGKELIAQLIHNNSSRCEGPYIRINCASIPNALLESEFFGYDEGAFTGAKKSGKPGLIETADGGTILLDEIAEIPFDLQAKLLRFLQEGEFVRVGGTKPRKVNVRILASTNHDLHKLIEKGGFRQDLFYRLYVVPVHIPPLRKRKDDIIPLVYQQMEKLEIKYNTKKDLAPEVVDILMNYDWPGNVRELQNLVEMLFVTSIGNIITDEYIPQNIKRNIDGIFVKDVYEMPLKEAIMNFEKKYIRDIVKRHGTVAKAAEILGVNQSTLFRKLKK